LRIRVLSDLHEEFAPNLGALHFPCVEADVTILAGDIANGLDALSVAARPEFDPGPVLLVPGNHEYYGGQLDTVLQNMREAAERMSAQRGASIRVLDRDAWIFEGVRFLGTTLWTDYALAGLSERENTMRLATPFMVDYRLIRKADGSLLTAQDTVRLHERDRNWLAKHIAEPFDGPTVVITHHAPHPRSVAQRFKGNPINGGFVSNLEDLMPGVDVWIHGHTHDGFDYVVDHVDGRKTRVLANPAGYRKRLPSPDRPFLFENKTYRDDWVIAL
jgi:predicted phosphodiesterase